MTKIEKRKCSRLCRKALATLAASENEAHVRKRHCIDHTVPFVKRLLKSGHACVPCNVRISLLTVHKELSQSRMADS